MYYAVKLYKDMPTDDSMVVAGIPLDWISEQISLGESTDLPEGSGWILMTEEELKNYSEAAKPSYDAWFGNSIFAPPPTQQDMINKVEAAMAFGQSLIVEFSALNAVSELTSEQIIEVSQRLAGIQALLSTGALYTALDAMQYVTVDAILPQAILDAFAQKIRNYLGI